MIMAEDTARRTPGLANVWIAGQTVRRRLRESGLRTRRPMIGAILKQRQRTARLTWSRARHAIVGGFTPDHPSFLVMNPYFHILLAMEVIVCTAGAGKALRTSARVCTSPIVFEAEVLWYGWNLLWWSHSAQSCSRNIECRKMQRRYSWSYRSALSARAKLWSRLSTYQCKMSRGSCLSRLSEPESHSCSSLAGIITGSVTN